MRIADLIAGVAGLHRTGPFAPILAAALTIPVAWMIHWIGGFPFLVVATLIGAAKVMWARPRASVRMVADRMIGQMIALWALSAGLWFAGVAPHVFPYPGWIGAFVMFNLLVALPPIARLAARHPLLDDVAAGAMAASVTLLAAGISHGWFG
ncbi:MAG: phosphatidylglycerophosphatase A [Pseudomonadota bacterium]